MKTKPVYRIVPGKGEDAEVWAQKLMDMYRASTSKVNFENEAGVHRFVYKNKDGLRCTVFVLVVHGDKEDWTKQVRSYVTYPYKLVKDHRTGKETKQVERVLSGDLDLIS